MDQNDDLLWAQQQWQQEGAVALQTASEAELTHFAKTYKVNLPADLARYFALINGTGGEYEDSLFRFYSLAEVQSVATRFHDYHGVPKYSDLLNTWPEHQQYYVVADHMFHLFAYAIRLDARPVTTNPVFVLCGGLYQQIAEGFTEFLALYRRDSAMLYMGDGELAE